MLPSYLEIQHNILKDQIPAGCLHTCPASRGPGAPLSGLYSLTQEPHTWVCFTAMEETLRPGPHPCCRAWHAAHRHIFQDLQGHGSCCLLPGPGFKPLHPARYLADQNNTALPADGIQTEAARGTAFLDRNPPPLQRPFTVRDPRTLLPPPHTQQPKGTRKDAGGMEQSQVWP